MSFFTRDYITAAFLCSNNIFKSDLTMMFVSHVPDTFFNFKCCLFHKQSMSNLFVGWRNEINFQLSNQIIKEDKVTLVLTYFKQCSGPTIKPPAFPLVRLDARFFFCFSKKRDNAPS